MLVLQRRWNESVIIGNDGEIKITVVDIDFRNKLVKLGINAPRDLLVDRQEVFDYLREHPETKRRQY